MAYRETRRRAVSKFVQSNPISQVTGHAGPLRVPSVNVAPPLPGSGAAFGGKAGLPRAPKSVAGPFGNTAPVTAPSGGADGTDPSVLPPDAGYEQVIGGLQTRRDNTKADLRDQRTGGLLDAGYTEDGQGNLTFDPANPNSRAALLLKHYQQSKTGTQNGMAARGQLFAGATVNAQNANDSSYQTADDAQRKALLRFLGLNTIGQRDAGTQYETDAGTALGERVGRASSSPLYNPTGPSSAPAPAAAAAGDPVVDKVPHTDSRGRRGTINVHKSGRRVFVAT